MDRRTAAGVLLVGVGVGVGLGLGGTLAGARAMPDAHASPSPSPSPSVVPAPPREPPSDAVPVLVELFTSEGCSSCPAADAVLARLEQTQPVVGARIVPLAMHVDYWDGLGWPDPFSSAAWTARQRAYAPLGGGNYTPQAVVDGREQTVGSRAAALERAIGEAAKRPHASVSIDVRAAAKESVFDLTVRIGALPPGSSTQDVDAVVALTQTRARIAVPRGENAGSTLDHTAIARELRVVGAASDVRGARFETSVQPPKGIGAEDVRVVAFVQERTSRRVLGVATRPLAPRP